MELPKLKISQYAVLICELSTGKVLTTTLERYNGSNESVYFYFDNLKLAKDFCLMKKAENTELQFAIYDASQNIIDVIR